jgi:hypothetical protein
MSRVKGECAVMDEHVARSSYRLMAEYGACLGPDAVCVSSLMPPIV